MKNQLMDTSQMVGVLESKPNRRLNHYKVESDEHKADELAADISRKVVALKRSTRVDLGDLYQVQERTFQYLEACQESGAYPSTMGLAALAFGGSTQWLNKFLRNNPDAPTAQFIEQVKSAFADILTNQALYRNADSTQAIFQLKNQHNFADSIKIEPVLPQNPLAPVTDAEERRKRIEAAVIDED